MSPPLLAEAGPQPWDRGETVSPPGPHPLALALGSSLVLWTTFPPADWGWLAWVALVPLFLLIPSRRPPVVLYLSAWAGGMVFWCLAIQWVRLTDPTAWVAWLVMALALSFFWPVFLGLARLAVLRLRLPMMIAAPVVWVALEYARAHVATGFPWYYLAHSQHLTLSVIQVSDFAGSLGVSFVIALANAWLVDVLTLPLLRTTARGVRLTLVQALRLVVVVAVLATTLGYGAYRIGTAQFRPGPRIALLQSSLVQRLKDSKNSHAAILALYKSLIARASHLAERPDLVIWPETSYPYGFIMIDPKMEPQVLRTQIGESVTVADRLAQRDDILANLRGMTDEFRIPMLVGSVTYDHRPEGLSRYNSAILLQPGTAAYQHFHKLHLVPFGEYVPLIKTFPWLIALTPYHGTHVPSLSFGAAPAWLTLGKYRLAPAICFEDTVPHVVRRFFSETKDGRHPDVLVNLSNDGWFHGSSEHEMHLAASIFRAVENRVPLARAANTGVSAIVDGNGRVLQSLATLEVGVLAGEVPLDDRTGLYSAWGDWLGQSCLAITIGLIPLAFLWPAWKRRRSE